MPLEVSLSQQHNLPNEVIFISMLLLADFLLCVRSFQKVPNSRSKKLKKKRFEYRIKYSSHPGGARGHSHNQQLKKEFRILEP